MSKKNNKKNKNIEAVEVEEIEVTLSSEETMEPLFNLSEESEAIDEVAAAEVFVQDTEGEGFLPDTSEEVLQTISDESVDLEGTELDSFEAVEIEEVEFIEDERLESIIESILFASDRPVSLASIKMVFQGTNIKSDRIRRTLNQLAIEYAGARRGITLEEVPGGYQLRTKVDNIEFLRRGLKARAFRLSGPALEVLAITAYKQPVIKSEIDEIRGVESGHMLRALMEKGLVMFAGKSELPGKPMQYATTKKFLEIFGLRNLKELPTLSQIDELIPEGIGDEADVKKEKLSDITDSLSQSVATTYSEGEDELLKISDQLQSIDTSSEFFAQEKQRQREKRDQEKAQNIREALAMNEEVSNRDKNWLIRYDEALAVGSTLAAQENQVTELNLEPQAAVEDLHLVEEMSTEEDSTEDDFDAADPSYDDHEAAEGENEGELS